MSRCFPRRVVKFFQNEEGVTAVECALMLALVVVICIVALAPSSSATPPSPANVTLEADRE
jgi:hypothetical protein